MSRTRKARRGRQKKKPGLNANCVQAQPGADGGTRTHMVSRTILSRLRLPFRHIGLWECPGCGPAPCRRLTAGAGPRNIAKPGASGAADPGPRPLHPAAPAYHVCYYSVSGVQNQAESFSFRKFGGRRGPGGANGRAGRGFRPSGRRGRRSFGRRIDGVISGRGGSSFFKKDFTNDTQLYII